MGLNKRKGSEQFAERFKELLKNTDKKELCDKLDITGETAFRQWSNGYTLPTSDKLKIISEHFNVSTDYLLGIENAKTHEVESLQQVTGFSVAACERLASWVETGVSAHHLHVLSFIIEHGYDFLWLMHKFLFTQYVFADAENAASFILPEDAEIYTSFPLVTFTDRSQGFEIIQASNLNDMHFGKIIREINEFKAIVEKKRGDKGNGKHNKTDE